MKKVILLLCVMQQVCSSACQGMWTGEENNWGAAGTSCAETMAQTHDPDDRDAAFLAQMNACRDFGEACCKLTPSDLDLFNFQKNAQSIQRTFGQAYPTAEALTCMENFIDGDEVLAAGCGSGFIEGKLEKRGVDIVATDIAPPKVRYMDIATQDVQSAMASHPQRNVLLIAFWKPGCPLDLSTFQGAKIISIGDQDTEFKVAGFIPDEDIWENVSGPHPPALQTLLTMVHAMFMCTVTSDGKIPFKILLAGHA